MSEAHLPASTVLAVSVALAALTWSTWDLQGYWPPGSPAPTSLGDSRPAMRNGLDGETAAGSPSTLTSFDGALVNGRAYYLSPANAPDKVLSAERRGVIRGTKVVLWDSDAEENHMWIALSLGSGLWSFAPTHAPTLRLDARNGFAKPCHLWSANPLNKNQRWWLQPAGEGRVFLRNGDGGVLDVANYETQNGAHVHVWKEITGKTNQKWVFRSAGAPVHGEVYYIVPRNAPSTVLGCRDREGAKGTEVVLCTNDGHPSVQWRAEDRGGSWTFHSIHAEGQRLDGNSDYGNRVRIWDEANPTDANQKWILEPTDSDYFILHREAGGVLDVAGYATDIGSHLHTWRDLYRNSNQQFRFRRVR